jgi:hypothetical protein
VLFSFLNYCPADRFSVMVMIAFQLFKNILVWLVLLLLYRTVATSLNCSIPAEQFNVLEEMFTTMGGDQWRWDPLLSNSTVWSFPNALSAPCTDEWQGVDCTYVQDESDHNCSITSLVLQSFRLRGCLPDAIGQIPTLQRLKLADNVVIGSIPSSIGSLASLTEFDVSLNAFNGSWPDALFYLTNVTHLDLSTNFFTGPIPETICSLRTLQSLQFSENYFSGELPRSIGCLTNLVNLSFYGNHLNGTIPDSLYLLTSLRYLYMGSIGITGGSAFYASYVFVV